MATQVDDADDQVADPDQQEATPSAAPTAPSTYYPAYTPGMLMGGSMDIAKSTALPPMNNIIQSATAGETPEQKSASMQEASQHLANAQNVIAAAPDDDRAALVQKQGEILQERADAQNRPMSTGERIAAGILGITPMLAAASSGRGHVLEAAQGGAQAVQQFQGARQKDIDNQTNQSDKQLASVEKDLSEKEQDQREAARDQAADTRQRRMLQQQADIQDQRMDAMEQKQTAAQQKVDEANLKTGITTSMSIRSTAAKLNLQKADIDTGLSAINQKAVTQFGAPIDQLTDQQASQVLDTLEPQERKMLGKAVAGAYGPTDVKGLDLDKTTMDDYMQRGRQLITGQSGNTTSGASLLPLVRGMQAQKDTKQKYIDDEVNGKFLPLVSGALNSPNPELASRAAVFMNSMYPSGNFGNTQQQQGTQPQANAPQQQAAPSAPQSWDDSKEARYQELLQKSKGGK